MLFGSKKLLFAVGIAFFACNFGWVSYSEGQISQDPVSAVVADSDRDSTAKLTLSGIVVDQNKYSFSISSSGQKFEVRLAPDAVVAMKMHKPWFDWDHQRVIVEPQPIDAGEIVDPDPKPVPSRVPVGLPGEKLFVIGQFNDESHMRYEMAQPRKRLNYYVITPTEVGSHFPSGEEPYISGKLMTQKSDEPVSLLVSGMKTPIILGFQNATLNGFSISDLTPYRTQVKLSGTVGPDKLILADRVLFYPVQLKTDDSNAESETRPAAAKTTIRNRSR